MQRSFWCRGEVISIAVNKKFSYGAMYIPDAGVKVKETKKVSKPSGMDELKDEIAELKDQLAKRNRDQDDAIYNLTLSNFSPDVRRRLDKVLNDDQKGDST